MPKTKTQSVAAAKRAWKDHLSEVEQVRKRRAATKANARKRRLRKESNPKVVEVTKSARAVKAKAEAERLFAAWLTRPEINKLARASFAMQRNGQPGLVQQLRAALEDVIQNNQKT